MDRERLIGRSFPVNILSQCAAHCAVHWLRSIKIKKETILERIGDIIIVVALHHPKLGNGLAINIVDKKTESP